MKVYIAYFGEDYEGEIVIGVCTTKELAEKVIEKDISDNWDDYFKWEEDPKEHFTIEETDLITE